VRRASTPKWDELEVRGDSIWRAQSSTNAFGIDDKLWRVTHANVLARKGALDDSTFVHGTERTPDWDDLDLLLTTMKVLGARPLILSTPLKGAYWNYVGVSASARDRVYRRFDSATASFQFPGRNFSERDGDVLFLSEPRSHLSAKGWLVYDRTIDAFYHDTLH
jgi:poly-D-alanine transfer protein DltD